MKTIHVPFCFRPDPVGGTEVYVEALAREQQRRGVDVVVAAPGRETSARADDDGLPVRRFATSPTQPLRSLYGDGDETARREFGNLVDQEEPDIVHLHSFTSAVSANLVHDVKSRGVRLIFTYHTPTVSCQRGTLLRWGRDVCDGHLDVHLCAGCALHGLGASERASALLGAVPSGIGQFVGGLGLAGGVWTGVRMSELVQTQHRALRAFMRDMDRVVVLCTWAGDLLARIGVPPEKLILSRHGLAQAPQTARFHSDAPPEGPRPLRIAFVGRLHPTKGLDIMLRAIAAAPEAQLELHVFGVIESDGGRSYAESLQTLAARDARVSFRAPVPSGQVTTLLRNYDILAVPSIWLETGPLVVLEAFAAGVPVLGSNRGGIAELVEDGVNGRLVEPASVDAWSAALRELTADHQLVQRLRAGVRPPRLMQAVADDMLGLYDEILEAA